MSDARFKCPHCGQIFAGLAEDAGLETDCPSCGKTFRLEILKDARPARPSGLMCYCGMFRNYVKFSGRAARREFWWAVLFNMLAAFLFGMADELVFDEYDDWKGAFALLYLLATSLPMLALQFRRLHDTNKSGWWWLLLPLPVVNLAYLVWLIDAGDKGRNRFGPDPKGRE